MAPVGRAVWQNVHGVMTPQKYGTSTDRHTGGASDFSPFPGAGSAGMQTQWAAGGDWHQKYEGEIPQYPAQGQAPQYPAAPAPVGRAAMMQNVHGVMTPQKYGTSTDRHTGGA